MAKRRTVKREMADSSSCGKMETDSTEIPGKQGKAVHVRAAAAAGGCRACRPRNVGSYRQRGEKRGHWSRLAGRLTLKRVVRERRRIQ